MKKLFSLLDLHSLRVQVVYVCLAVYVFCVLRQFDSAILTIISNTLIAAFSFYAGSRTVQNYIESKNGNNNGNSDINKSD